MAENSVVYTGTGRRKEAVARVRLVPGTGKVIVNGREAKQYFGRQQLVDNALAPLRLTETAERFDVLANLDGGGINGPVRRASPGHRPRPARRRRVP